MNGEKRTYGISILVAALVVSVAGGSAAAVGPTGLGSTAADTGATGDLDTYCQSDGYEVTFTNVEIETWRLINVTALDAVVREVEVANLRTANGTASDVTLENVSLRRFEIDNATLSGVSADELVVRNKSILSVPGADLVGDISNRTIDRHVLKDVTISGLVIDSLAIENMTIGERRLVENSGGGDAEPTALPTQSEGESADIEMRNGSIDSADIGTVTGVGWKVERSSVGSETITNNSTVAGAALRPCAGMDGN